MRSLFFAMVVVGLSSFFVSSSSVAQDTGAKTPPPTREALEAAAKLVRDLYKAEFAKTGRADRLALAKKLFERGVAVADSPTDRFVLWRESAQVAISAGDAALAWKSIAAIEKQFAVSGYEQKAAALESARAKLNVSDAARLSQAALVEFDRASGVDPVSAGRLLAFAQSAARQTKDAALQAKIEARAKTFERTQQEIDAGKSALEALKKSPEDPEANLKAGRYLCFMLGDWAAGLPLLARGSAENLQALAQKDLANPKDGKARLDLADAWYDQAKDMVGAPRTHVLARACAWYRGELPSLTGFTKVRVEKRLAELASIPVIPLTATPIDATAKSPTTPTTPTTPTVSTANWLVLFRSSDPSIWNSEIRRGSDDFAVSLAKAPADVRFLKMTNLASGASIIVEATRNQLGTTGTQGRYRWIGHNSFHFGGRHLGIADMDFMAAGNTNRGNIELAFSDYKMTSLRPNWQPGRQGWGFGSRCMMDDVQGFAWGPGKVLETTAFEIAVTAGPLGSVEAASFLSDDLVKLAKIQGVASLPGADAWLTVFRSSDPSDWGLVDRKEKDKDHFALDLRKVPEGIRYLKLTNTSSAEFVIVETTKQALYAFDSESSCGWRGDDVVQFKGAHLGICDRQCFAKAGEVTIAHNPGANDCGGWGFGHRHSRNDVQGYSWAGQPIGVTVFEIAVRSGTLTEAEKAKVLPR